MEDRREKSGLAGALRARPLHAWRSRARRRLPSRAGEEARVAELAQDGGFEPLYPKDATTLNETAGHLQLLRPAGAEAGAAEADAGGALAAAARVEVAAG